MPSPSLSIVIPTHERADILARCLHHLSTQTIANQLEVIVVSDGHDPATSALFQVSKEQGATSSEKNLTAPCSLLTATFAAFHFLEIEKTQQGTARNRGVEKASAPRVLFIGDDIFLEPHACEVHIKEILNSPFSILNSAILGYTTWDPAIGITPVMRWLEKSGWQFGYPAIQQYSNAAIPPAIQPRFTYTSHISLPAAIAKQFLFREDVTLYGWEDIEWGARLRDAGIPLIFEPDARALHHHQITLESSLRRMEVLGESAVRMEKLLSGFDRLPRGWKRIAYEMSAMLPTMAGRHRRAFLMGMKNTK